MAKARGRKVDSTDRLPPHAPDMERGVLSCILQSPSLCAECIVRFRSRSDVFYDLRHQTVIEAMMMMHRAGDIIEVHTLHQHLKDEALLEQAGGFAYLQTLPDAAPSSANLVYYLDQVCEKYQLRRLLQACTNISARVFENHSEVEALLDGAEREIGQVFSERIASGRFLTVDDLDSFDASNDRNSLLGNRWLCRGGKLLVPAASGAGKSSLAMQMLVLFALGKDFCGIMPARPLSSIIVGDENDEGDMAEMFQGTRDFLQITAFEHNEHYDQLRRNMKFWDCPALTGDKFITAIEQELLKCPRDIACLDPLVSFAGCDLTKQDAAAKFLREGLSRISARTGVIWFVIHHTPKPVRDQRAGGARKISDYQYSGAGTFDLPGWARAVMTLDESTYDLYRLILSKRGQRAGAKHPDGSPTKVLWMKHATNGIHWEQVEPPVEAESSRGPKEKPLTKPQQIATLNLGTFLSHCPKDGESLRAVIRRLTSWLASKDCPKRSLAQCSHGSLNTAVGLMLENDKLSMSNGLYFKGSQA